MRFLIVWMVLLFGAGCSMGGATSAVSFSPEKLVRRAETYCEKGRYLEALSFYRDIYRNAWNGGVAATLLKGLGDLYYFYLADGPAALELYRKFCADYPADKRLPDVYRAMAKIYYARSDRQQAEALYKCILKGFPDFFVANNLAHELLELEKGGGLLDDVTLSLDRTLPQYVRVLIVEGARPVEVSATGAFGVYTPEQLFVKKKTGARVVVSARGSRVCLDGKPTAAGSMRLTAEAGGLLRMDGRTYRGFFWVYADDDDVIIINHVGLESYLYGVLPREVSPSWPQQALQAQAVAARTYALYHMLKRETKTYDVFSTTSSQVYGGHDNEAVAAQRAVDATRGLIVAHADKVALTLYHSNSGGTTEASASVWGAQHTYLQSREDAFSRDRPGFSWSKSIGRDDITRKLQAFGLPVTDVTDIRVQSRSGSGRAVLLDIVQTPSEKSFTLSGNSFRLIVGAGKVRSTNFTVERKRDRFVFSGSGFGHGVGMSQWGAYAMAKSGSVYTEILGFYYPETSLTRITVL